MPPANRGKAGQQSTARRLHMHSRVSRDAIMGITKPAIRRLARRSGVKRISATVYDEIRMVMAAFL